MTTLAHYTGLLDAVGEPYAVLPLHDGASALITRRGGRVLGLFPAPDAPNLFWTSKAFDSVEAFKAFTTRTDGWAWNLGGERVWIAPEIRYNVRDRRDFGGTWDIPRAMDPGDYGLNTLDHRVWLEQSLTLTAFDGGAATGEITLQMARIHEIASNPLAGYPVMGRDVQYFGYLVDMNLQTGESHAAGSPYCEAWTLVQLNAGGTLIIPVIGQVGASDYVKPVPDFARQVTNGAVHLPLNGREQFKIGYKALCMTGRMGYLHDLPDGRSYLLVRHFQNDPSNLYAEEPPDEPGNTGHSVHVYNDGGGADQGRPFCEMECNGRTLGAFDRSTRVTSSENLSLWAYVGVPYAIREIAHLLLGSAP